LSADRSWTIAAGITGSGATGQVAYWNGASSQTGSNNLFWDAANSRLGIGLTNPAYGLDVSSTVRFSNSTAMSTGYSFAVQRLQFNNGVAGGNIGMIRAASNGIMVMTNAAEGDFTRLAFGNNTTSFPALQRSGLSLCVVDGAGGTLGNLIVGGTSDGGQRLQVQGDAAIRGSGSSAATSAFIVDNNNPSRLFEIFNSGVVQITNSLRVNTINSISGILTIASPWAGSTSTIIQTWFGGNNGLIVEPTGTVVKTSGDFTVINGRITFAPISGTTTSTTISATPTINQTGGANGITRGLYVAPTLTAAADWRAIEWSNNSGWGLFGAGSSNNYLGGRLGLNTITLNNVTLRNEIPISGSTSSFGYYTNAIIESGVTNQATYFLVSPRTQGASFNLTRLSGFEVGTLNVGSGSSVTEASAFYGNIANGTGRWNLYMNGTADNYLAGKLVIGTTTVSTFALDVNGTARVSDNLTVSKNQNAATLFTLSNTTSGTASQCAISLISDSNKSFGFGKYSTLTTSYKILSGGDSYIFNSSNGGDLSIFNDTTTGNIKFAAGGSPTVQMTLHSNGNLTARSTLPSTLGATSFNFFLGLSGLINASATVNDIGINNNAYFNGTNVIYKNNGIASNLFFDNSGNISFSTAPSGTAGSILTFIERVRIKPNGSVRYIPMATPASSEAGDVYYDSTLNKLRCYDGTTWNDLF
jgi:hypothetical protein